MGCDYFRTITLIVSCFHAICVVITFMYHLIQLIAMYLGTFHLQFCFIIVFQFQLNTIIVSIDVIFTIDRL